MKTNRTVRFPSGSDNSLSEKSSNGFHLPRNYGIHAMRCWVIYLLVPSSHQTSMLVDSTREVAMTNKQCIYLAISNTRLENKEHASLVLLKISRYRQRLRYDPIPGLGPILTSCLQPSTFPLICYPLNHQPLQCPTASLPPLPETHSFPNRYAPTTKYSENKNFRRRNHR